ncbi:MAG TPA: hypothetical protein PLK12_09515 [Prolixibacteraceae bacterium]|nr:hypothetical protein [Prolixibacteraceae bacterium]
MIQECIHLPNCGFFKKYQSEKDLACKGFINQYCRGPKQNECKRLQFKKINGYPPSDDMMPTGQMMRG